MLSKLKTRLRALLRRSEMKPELDEELQNHVERQTEQNIRMGMNTEDARCAARKVHQLEVSFALINGAPRTDLEEGEFSGLIARRRLGKNVSAQRQEDRCHPADRQGNGQCAAMEEVLLVAQEHHGVNARDRKTRRCV